MPSQLLAIVWIVSTSEKIGERLKSFPGLNKNSNFQGYLLSIVWIVSTGKQISEKINNF